MKTEKNQWLSGFLKQIVSKKSIRILLSVIITIVLLYLLLSQIKLDDIINILKKSSVPLLLLSTVFYIVSLYLRAFRFKVLLNNKVDMKLLFPITLFYNCANTVVPMRLGELSYVYLLKKSKKASSATALSSLIVSRLFDVLAIILTLLIALFLAKNIPVGLRPFVPLVILSLFFLLIVMLVSIFWQTPVIWLFNLIHDLIIRNKNSYFKKKFAEITASFSEMKSKSMLAFSLILSLVMSLLLIIYTVVLSEAMGFKYSPVVLTVVICLSTISSVIPISGINGFGTTETVWALLMAAMGYSISAGVILSFSLHIMQTIVMLVFGFIGWLGVREYM